MDVYLPSRSPPKTNLSVLDVESSDDELQETSEADEKEIVPKEEVKLKKKKGGKSPAVPEAKDTAENVLKQDVKLKKKKQVTIDEATDKESGVPKEDMRLKQKKNETQLNKWVEPEMKFTDVGEADKVICRGETTSADKNKMKLKRKKKKKPQLNEGDMSRTNPKKAKLK